MTVALVMCAGGRAANPVAAIESVRELCDTYTVVDTGIDPALREAVEASLEGLTGDLIEEPFAGSGPSFTHALQAARGKADWLLHLHADETAEVFPTFPEWLAGDPHPETPAYTVEIQNPWMVHRLPRLLRGDREWTYVGEAHEYLAGDPSSWRDVVGLSLTHRGSSDPQKFLDTLERLRPGYEAGLPRETFYFAETLRDLGRPEEAVEVYRLRASMTNGWDEERWYAEYQAAKLTENYEWLLYVWRQRPHRHEPLQAAARIVAARGSNDRLFRETVG